MLRGPSPICFSHYRPESTLDLSPGVEGTVWWLSCGHLTVEMETGDQARQLQTLPVVLWMATLNTYVALSRACPPTSRSSDCDMATSN